MTALFAVLVMAAPGDLNVRASAADGPAASDDVDVDGRVEVAHLLGTAGQPGTELSLTELRALVDAAYGGFSLHLDGRGRLAWSEGRESEERISRMFAGYRGDNVHIGAGRQIIADAGSARVDGISAGLTLTDGLEVGAFGGLMPHPLTDEFNKEFLTAGLYYRLSGDKITNPGGLVVQTYAGDLERAYATQRLSWRVSDSVSMFGSAIVDMYSFNGITGETIGQQSIDLTQAHLMVRYRAARAGSVSLRLGHNHTVLPRVWWQDWVARERSSRGFVVFEEEPVGTRRTSATLSGNLRLGANLKPYLVARYDRRHNDDEDAYQARGGIKLLFGSLGYLDAYYSYRRHFVVDNHIGALRCGLDLSDAVSLDSGLTAMHTRPHDADAGDLLFDVDAGVWVNLGGFSDSLQGVRLLVHYLGFVEPDVTYHWGHVRLSYRL